MCPNIRCDSYYKIFFFQLYFFVRFLLGYTVYSSGNFISLTTDVQKKKLQQAMSLPRVTVASGAHANFRSIDATEMKFLFPDRKCPHPYAKMSPSKLNFREKKGSPSTRIKSCSSFALGSNRKKIKRTLGRDTIPMSNPGEFFVCGHKVLGPFSSKQKIFFGCHNNNWTRCREGFSDTN